MDDETFLVATEAWGTAFPGAVVGALVLVFVDEGTPMARLVGKLASAQRAGRTELPGEVSADDVERLQGAFRAESQTKRRPDRTDEAVPGVIEPLTDREMQVLGLMAAGRSNREIADELVVVLDTVKKHVGHILDKLGAANRTQAVARARVVGLLP